MTPSTSPTIRSHHVRGARLRVRRLAGRMASMRRAVLGIAPTTMLVPPRSMPSDESLPCAVHGRSQVTRPRARTRLRPTARACSGDDPAGNLRPVAIAGTAGERRVLDDRVPRRRGPNPKSGTVGPKIATVGVPIADARCSGAESLVTSTAARADQLRRCEERERARGARTRVRTPRRRIWSASAASSRPPTTTTHRRVERRARARHSTATASSPTRSRRERDEPPRRRRARASSASAARARRPPVRARRTDRIAAAVGSAHRCGASDSSRSRRDAGRRDRRPAACRVTSRRAVGEADALRHARREHAPARRCAMSPAPGRPRRSAAPGAAAPAARSRASPRSAPRLS